MTTVAQHVGAARARLVRAGLAPDVAALDAEVLARDVLGWDRATYVVRGRGLPPAEFAPRYDDWIARRAGREPVSLITGHREFWGREFEVTPDVLTPRPETELVVEEALRALGLPGSPDRHVVDVGTGSGCLAITVASEARACTITAVDVSRAALDTAQRNAARHGVVSRIRWVCAAFLDGVELAPDIIMANLPYVPDSELDSLPPEVRCHEPRSALAGGADGLDAIRELVHRAATRLTRGGVLVIECGAGQHHALGAFIRRGTALTVTRTRPDLQGIPRVLVAERS